MKKSHGLKVYFLAIATSWSCLCMGLKDQLTPPILADEYVKERVTCIRPTREGIFNISSEIRAGKLIIHNYGHGGAGWTLLFGSVHRALREFAQQYEEHPELHGQEIRVIGAGAQALWTAIELKRAGFRVKIVAKDIFDLTSHKGAGIFAPGPMQLSTDEEKIRDEVLINSYRAWEKIAARQDPYFMQGADFMPLYVGVGTQSGLEPLVDAGFIQRPQAVEIDFLNESPQAMIKFDSIFMDTRKMMGEFHKKLNELDINLEVGTIHDFAEIKEPIIFNCSGLGSGILNHDNKVTPVQGHLLTLKNQPNMNALKYMVYLKVDNKDTLFDEFGHPIEEYIYFTPKGGGTIGGTYIVGEARLDTNQDQHDLMLHRAREFFGESPLY